MNAIDLATLQAPVTSMAAARAPCLLVNPRSFEVATGDLAARAMSLARAHGADAIEVRDPAQIADGLDRALEQGPRPLVVLAGDGTVQAVIDYLAGRPAGTSWPALLVLGGGRTNLTAVDLDGGGAALQKLESALIRLRRDPVGGLRVLHRQVLVVEQPPAPPRHGFFVAAAIVDSLIRHFHERRDAGTSRLRKGHYGTAWLMLREAVPALRGREPYVFPDLAVELPGCGNLQGPTRLLLATTLVHDRWYFHPYASRGAGALRVTAVAGAARGFWRSLPRLVTGRFTAAMTPERGYLSGRCDSCSVAGLNAYTLDGQSFTTDPARPVVIRTGPRVPFLVP